MNREAVQHERGPRNSTIRKQMTDMISARQMSFLPFHPIMRPIFYPFNPILTPTEDVSAIKEESKPVIKLENNPPPSPHLPPTPPPSEYSSRLQVCEKAANILFINTRWVKTLPTFQVLQTKDQVTIYRNSWIKLFVLYCAQVLTLEDLENLQSEKISEPQMTSFLSAVKGLQSLRLSSAENGYVRGVVLFKHGRDILDQIETSRDIIAAVADQAHVALAQSMMIKTGNNPLQFAKMMMILAEIENISSDFIHQQFFKDTLGDISIDVIVMDMLKSQH